MPRTKAKPGYSAQLNFYKQFAEDPLGFFLLHWPHHRIYDKQEQIALSIRDNLETFVPAANEMGKDYDAGWIMLWFFLTRQPVRVVTTSAGEDHLCVLWDEAERFLATSRLPLLEEQGGPIRKSYLRLYKVDDRGDRVPISYCSGLVASADKIEKMGGHHANPENLAEANDGIPRTLGIGDEASSIVDEVKNQFDKWAKRQLWIGNTWPCENFFKKCCNGGDIQHPGYEWYDRKVIRIAAVDHPNIKLALKQIAMGLKPTGEQVLPGKDWFKYESQRRLWDAHQQAVGLDAVWYEGRELKLYPSDWLQRAKHIAAGRPVDLYDEEKQAWQRAQIKALPAKRKARAMGIDPAEGGDKSVWVIVDELGVLCVLSLKTPDTTVIPARTKALMREWDIPPERVYFDKGGGGKEHADRLRLDGFKVSMVAFGETIVLQPKRGMRLFKEKVEVREEKYAYKNKRAEMYYLIRLLLDPTNEGFAIPEEYAELHRQLGVMPLCYDEEGKIFLPPKQLKSGEKENPEKPTISKLLGCSPDEADALALAVYGMTDNTPTGRAGVI